MVLHNRLTALITTASLTLILILNLIWAHDSSSANPDTATINPGNIPASDWQHTSPGPGAFYGAEILILDVDGDLDEDIVVAAPFEDDGSLGADVGAVYIYANNFGSIPTTPTQILRGTQAGERFGEGLTGGYFDDDSFVDLAVGAPGHISDATGTDLGAVYVLSGTGSASTPFVPTAPPTLYGQAPGSDFGTSLATISNISNPDIHDELVVGSPKYGSAGAVFVYINLLGGFPVDPTFMLSNGEIDGRFGFALSTADYDGDAKHNDLAIGAPSDLNSSSPTPGSAYIYKLIESGSDPNIFYTATLLIDYKGENSGDLFGHDVELVAMNPLSTSQADLLVGVPGFQILGNQAGGAIAYYQNEAFDPAADIQTTTALDDADWVAEAKFPGGMFGYAVTGADFDNDSFMDVIGSAKFSSINHPNEGGLFFYLSQGTPFPTGTSPSWMSIGNGQNAYLGSSLTTGDLAASSPFGPKDIIVGASGQGGSGIAHIYFTRSGGLFTGPHLLTNDSPVRVGSPVSLSIAANGGEDNVYLWDFGDGTLAFTADDEGEGQTISHPFQTAGNFNVSVSAMNPAASDFITTDVAIQIPFAQLDTATTSPTRLGNLTFLKLDLGAGQPVTFRVNYGDNSAEKIYIPSSLPLIIPKLYTQPGSYQVVITAENGVDLVTDTVEISVYKPTAVSKTGGANFTHAFVEGSSAGSKITITVPAGSTDENVEMRFVPRPDAGLFPDNNSGLTYFDLHILEETAVNSSSGANFVSCLYMPMVSSGTNPAPPSGSGTVNPFAGICTSIPQFNFLKPVIVTLSYPDSAIPSGVDETDLVLKYFDETQQQWVDGRTSCPSPSPYVRDPENNLIQVQICHQSRWSWRAD